MNAVPFPAQPSSDPPVSVLLPVHNGGAFLVAALVSMLGQTLSDLEVVAVENGSTDDSLAVLKEWAERDPRVRVIEAGPVGLVAALNLAIGAARGRYLARMDADDLAEPQRLERQVEFLRAHPGVGVLGTAHDYIDESGATVGSRRFVTAPALVEASFFFGNPLAHPTVMIDRHRTGPLTYPTTWPDAEDLALWLSVSRSGVALANLGEVMMHYRVHPDSVTAHPDAAVGTSDVDAVVAACGWSSTTSRWVVARTFNAGTRGVSISSFLLGVVALNLLNLVRPQVGRIALAHRSALAVAARTPRVGRR